MLITDNLIYLELHKTGCSHTLRILADLYKDEHRIIGKHNAYDSVSKRLLGDFDQKIKMGNIRNPWDWYVSLWAFGCQKIGALYISLTSNNLSFVKLQGVQGTMKRVIGQGRPRLSPEMWKSLYSDPNNIDNFRTWLRLLLEEQNYHVGEEFKKGQVSSVAGFLTYRYLRLFTYRTGLNDVSSLEELVEFDSRNNFLDLTLRNEHLHEDILNAHETLGFSKDTVNTVLAKFDERTNSSSRIRDYREYYNTECAEIVEKYDSFIINKYDYSFDKN